MKPESTNHLLLCYYGDDFTGSTDSMEALAAHGVKTVLFLQPPTIEQLKEKFPDIQCFGVAGTSRSMTPEAMERELQQVFRQLQLFKTPIVHYKVCSTFDSSPAVGSIGKVIDIGKQRFAESRVIPLLVGAPALQRYTVFGNHFATVCEDTYRLDRHPTMSKHPITPMHESDLRIHLNNQTSSKIALMDLFDLEGDLDAVIQRFERRLESRPDVMLFDVFDQKRLETAGALLWRETQTTQLFVVGSSGVQYALTSYWKSQGMIDGSNLESMNHCQPVEQLLVISGSCSPVTR
ncbi:four-carbon acid sugar kinase family protein [Fodinisporobacter ferrooxydans]|uniref:Four-carbon acid sugar kinase family protein n=1 Tax=Fodinisporobacter ferrooxydans TaxID=2901836 RepID=A0ABY4CLH2_9BACL|nr:four-carbon acid sugar kinase family protein [Alicyclobacillaceae bacterium MYW30-H2]